MQHDASPCGLLSFVWHPRALLRNIQSFWFSENFKSSIQSFPRSCLLGFGSRLTRMGPSAWFIVSTNGFKRNIWAWSSEKSLSPGFLWWHSKKTSGRHETPFERKSRAPPRDVSRRVSLLINRHISSACSVKSRVFETKGEKKENTN